MQQMDARFEQTVLLALHGDPKPLLGAMQFIRSRGDRPVVQMRLGTKPTAADIAALLREGVADPPAGYAGTAGLEALAAGPRGAAAAAMRAVTHRLLPLSPAAWPPVAELVACVHAATNSRFAHADHDTGRLATQYARNLVFVIQQLLLRLNMPFFREPMTAVGSLIGSSKCRNKLSPRLSFNITSPPRPLYLTGRPGGRFHRRRARGAACSPEILFDNRRGRSQCGMPGLWTCVF